MIQGKESEVKKKKLASDAKRIVFAVGCFDLFHIGHLKFIEAAASLGDFLVLGVGTSEHMRALRADKGDEIIPFDQRREIVGALRYVDATMPYEPFETDDFSVFDEYDVSVWAVGPEHGRYEFQGRVDRELKHRGVELVVIPRTPNVSTTMIKKKIRGIVTSKSSSNGGEQK